MHQRIPKLNYDPSMSRRKSKVLSEYRLAVGPNGYLYIRVYRKPHLCYTLTAFRMLVQQGKIK